MKFNLLHIPIIEVEFLAVLAFRYRFLLIWIINIPRVANVVSSFYGFETIFDFSYNAIINYQHGYVSYIYYAVAILILFIINILIAARSRSIKKRIPVSLWLLLLTITLSLYQVEVHISSRYNLVGLPSLNYLRQYLNFTIQDQRLYKSTPVYDAQNLADINIYYFLLESHTMLLSEELSTELYSHITHPFSRQKLKAKFGSTFRGELRELCGLIAYPDIALQGEALIDRCLPKKMSASHRTIALHGGFGGMYRRNLVYPQMGFNEVYSLIDFGSIESCGGGWRNFPCDTSILDFFEANIKDERTAFTYFLNLNTHSPFRATSYAIEECPAKISQDIEMCTHFRNLAGLISFIDKFATRNPGLYIIAGDHPPPGLQGYFSADSFDRIVFMVD